MDGAVREGVLVISREGGEVTYCFISVLGFFGVTGRKSCSTFSHTKHEISSSTPLDLSSFEPVESMEEVVCDSS